MTSMSHLVTTPSVLRARNYQWHWNCTTGDPWSSINERWEKYSDVDNEIIEDAYNEKLSDIELDRGYRINLQHSYQYKRDHEYSARPIKRVQFDKDRNHIYPRQERFLLPIALTNNSTSSFHQSYNDNELKSLRLYGYITSSYWELEVKNKKKTVADIVEEASYGIIHEGSIINKLQEALWISKQLLAVKDFGSNTDPNFIKVFPLEIGETCAYLYTKESFLYKLINHILRNLHSITREQVTNLGPFCWLLDWYLYAYSTRDIPTVYRSVNLDDEQRQQFTKSVMLFTSFTSTTRNRKVAEFFNGNTLLIIDLNQYDKNHNYIICGKNISSLSDFPEEEEFLIWPGKEFAFVNYEYDTSNNKHLIYLKASKVD